MTELENEKLNFKEQLDKANERVAQIQKEQEGESDALIMAYKTSNSSLCH